MDKVSTINSLNGIRGFAVLLVLFSHASNSGLSIHPELSFSGAGRYGVFLFFVLSAFLLTRQFLESNPSKEELKPFIRHYFLRRVLRIYPLFIASITVYYLLNVIGYSVINLNEVDLIKHIVLLEGEGIFWTIPVEFQYYFVLPIVALILSKAENAIVTTIFILAFSVFWWLAFPPEYVANLVPFAPIFIIGSCAAFVSHRLNNSQQRLIQRWEYALNFGAIFFFAMFFVFTPRFFNTLFSQGVGRTEFHEQFLLFSILSASLILCVIHGNGVINKIMESRLFVFWGKVSFSAYLGHMIILSSINKIVPFSSSIKLAVFVVLTAFFSYLSFKYFEVPLSKTHNIKGFYSKIKSYYLLARP